MAGPSVEVQARSVASNADVDFLTNEQRLLIINEIDQTCADTWCEGDFHFSFDDLICSQNNNQCTLMFRMFGDMTQSAYSGVYSGQDFDWSIEVISNGLALVECTINGVSSYEDLVASGGVGGLSGDYYLKLNGCITQIEKKFLDTI